MKDRISQLLDESASHARARLDRSPTPMPAALSGAIHRRRRNIIITRVSVVMATLLCVGTVLVLSLPAHKGTPDKGTSNLIAGGQDQTPPVEIPAQELETSALAHGNPTLSRLSKTIHREGIESAMELLTGSPAQGDGSAPYSPRSTFPEYIEGH